MIDRANAAGLTTGTTSSSIRCSQIAPGQYGSPWWMAASNGSSWKSKGIRRAEMLIDIAGCCAVNPPMRGISQRVPKVGSTARFRLSLPAKLIAWWLAVASEASDCRTSAA